MAFSGATGTNSDLVNGIFLFQDVRNGMPVFKNLVSQRYCYRASDRKWYVSTYVNFMAKVLSKHVAVEEVTGLDYL